MRAVLCTRLCAFHMVMLLLTRNKHIHTIHSPIGKHELLATSLPPIMASFCCPNRLIEELHVLDNVGEEFITLSFYFLGTPHSLVRPRGESIHKALTRMSLTIRKKAVQTSKKASAKAKAAGKPQSALAPIAEYKLLSYSEEIEEILDASILTNGQWSSGMRIMIMQSYRFTVVVNPPTIASMKIYPSKALFIGCPILPVVDIFNGNGIEFTWFREEKGEWIQETEGLERGNIFTPSEKNVGKRLKVFATPYDLTSARCGRSTVHYLSSVVADCPLTIPRINGVRTDFYESSLKLTHTLSLSKRIRVMSYNILADAYATSKAALKYLFSYCPVDFLQIEYRSQLILQELLTSNSDIFCLQEVDESVYHLYYAPHLESRGYRGCYVNKRSEVTEGCAIFVKQAEFSLLYSIDVPLKEIIKNDSSVKSLFQGRSELFEFVCGKLGMIAQICICAFQCDPTKIFLIANTHLFYHPAADFIRLLQTHAIVSLVTDIKRSLDDDKSIMGVQEYFKRYDNAHVHYVQAEGYNIEQLTECNVIIAGDFNSTPETPAIAYLEGSNINADHEIWNSVDAFKTFKDDENDEFDSKLKDVNTLLECTPPECLQHNLSSLVNVSGFPQYTNFTKGFQDCLDYIYVSLVDTSFQTAVAPYPSYEVLTEKTALPSIDFPSDHLPVVVDIFITHSS